MRPSKELLLRAYALADSAAISDIECWCAEWEGSTREGRWYNTAIPNDIAPDETEFLAAAVRYLELRGILVRKPGMSHVVSFDRSRVQEAL